jgi:hypothetical protein
MSENRPNTAESQNLGMHGNSKRENIESPAASQRRIRDGDRAFPEITAIDL